MFKKIIFASLIMLPQLALTFDEDSGVNPAAKELYNALAKTVFFSPHVTGIDIGGCDAAGAPDNFGPESCVRIFCHTAEGVAAFKVIYPQGVKVNGAYISIQFMHKPRPQ